MNRNRMTDVHRTNHSPLMSRIRRRSTALLALVTLALVLSLALTACGARGAHRGGNSNSGNNGVTSGQQNNGGNTTTTGSNTNGAQQLQNADQQMQGIMHTLDGAAQNAQNADNNSQEGNGQP